MKPPTHFDFTAHAKKRAEERGITEHLFKEVVLKHEKKTRQYRGKNGGFVYLFSRKYGEKVLHIAAEVRKENCSFVTGYWTP